MNCTPDALAEAATCFSKLSAGQLDQIETYLFCQLQNGGGGGSGTVTSVAMTVPAFLSVAGSPITTSGTLAVTLAGALPTANGGVAAGGNQGDVLVKHSGSDFDEVWKPQNPVESTLTDGATITWTVDPELADQKAKVTLGGNRTLAFSGVAAGMSGRLKVIQSGGGNSLTLPAGSKVANAGAGAVTLSAGAGAVDILVWEYDGTNYWWVISLNFT